MTENELIDAVRHETGLSGEAWARAALRATLSSLGSLLPSAERSLLALRLPAELAEIWLEAEHDPLAGRADVIEAVAAVEGVREGFALEHAQGVMRAVGQLLDPGERRALRAHFSTDTQDLFPEPRRSSPPGPTPPLPAGRPASHLSDGRPTSSHPISEAHADRAQSQSVARTDAPHADTKLSSARGTTQVREHETLAEAKPEED